MAAADVLDRSGGVYRGAPSLQWSLQGTRHVEITTIVTPVRVRGVRVTFDAALVAKVI